MKGSPNRFVRAIRSGEIESVDDLKAAFRELALATHPDVAKADSGEAFIAVRAEFEAALTNFERHRFGVDLARGKEESSSAAFSGVGAAELWSCLALLRKRGFPKEPRHEKEILRYEYARWRFRGALRHLSASVTVPAGAGKTAVESFDAFESEALAMKKKGAPLLAVLLSYLDELVDYAARRLPAMRVALVRSYDAIRDLPGLSPGGREFLAVLSAELGIGPTIG
ncbi:MAG TPA: hypothetical protein VMV83_02945 [Rectinemataceae bacterium]|nr:hypothetical protein [Rectinemataceae bacterium]